MGLYDTLNPEEGRKEFEHFMFKELLPISMEQKRPIVSVIQIKHIPIKVDQELIQILQQEDPPYY